MLHVIGGAQEKAQEKLRQLQVAGRAGFVVEEPEEEEEEEEEEPPEEDAEEPGGSEAEGSVSDLFGDEGDGDKPGGAPRAGAALNPSPTPGDGPGAGPAGAGAGAGGPGADARRASVDYPEFAKVAAAAGRVTPEQGPRPPDPRVNPYSTSQSGAAAATPAPGRRVPSPMTPQSKAAGPVGEACEIEPSTEMEAQGQAQQHGASSSWQPRPPVQARQGSNLKPGQAHGRRSASPLGESKEGVEGSGEDDRPSGTQFTLAGYGEITHGRRGSAGGVPPMLSSPEGGTDSPAATGGRHRQRKAQMTALMPDDYDEDPTMAGHWMRTAVSSKGARVMATGTSRRTSIDMGHNRSSAQHSVVPLSSRPSAAQADGEQLLLSPGGQGERERQGHQPPPQPAVGRGGHRGASGANYGTPEPPSEQSGEPHGHSGAPSNDSRLRPAPSRARRSTVENGPDAGAAGGPPHMMAGGTLGSAGGAPRRLIRRMSTVASGMSMGSQGQPLSGGGTSREGHQALAAAEAEVARLRREVARLEGEAEEDFVLKRSLFEAVHGLAGVVEGLGGQVAALEGRMGLLEGAMQKVEMAQRASSMMLGGGGGGILGATIEVRAAAAWQGLCSSQSLFGVLLRVCTLT